ncbi:hypothetical protein, partial [Atlantibacter hermannii]|uniref:hypothetical protein n=1 Tax=Atlantibacter hermannii TaxID=565 RepID=UPI002899DCE0
MMFALGGGACFVGWYCSVRLAGGAFLGFVELIRSPDWRGFFVFVELFRSPDWRGFFVFVESFRSLWAAVRINSHRRTRPGWGRSPPRP